MVTMQDRRSFIRAMMATAGAASAFTPAIARALEIPADRRTGTLKDVGHVVILTQENRSFDHYFGAMRGVRGYGDRFAIPAPPLPRRAGPHRPRPAQRASGGRTGADRPPSGSTPPRTSASIARSGTPHGFVDSQAAWDNGRMGAWPRSKQNQAMAHFTRADLPFQYAPRRGLHPVRRLSLRPATCAPTPTGCSSGPARTIPWPGATARPSTTAMTAWTPIRCITAAICGRPIPSA